VSHTSASCLCKQLKGLIFFRHQKQVDYICQKEYGNVEQKLRFKLFSDSISGYKSFTLHHSFVCRNFGTKQCVLSILCVSFSVTVPIIMRENISSVKK
jgi:hypothetical protein